MRNTLLHTSTTARWCWLSAVALMLLCAAPALAWAPLGHRIVGELAQRQLSPQAAAAVADLLRGEPEPTLAGVANWADTLRQSDPARFTQTQAWHYDDFPRGDCNYVPPRDCPGGNCVTEAIPAQQKILADPAQPRQARIDALKFLVHFVGDIHQPFHAGYADDKGGNGYQISLRTDIPPQDYARKDYVNGVMGTNLHAVWDFYVLANHHADARDYADALAARKSADANAPADETRTSGGPMDWVLESCRIITAESLYPEGHKLDAVYLEKMRPLAERRLIQAGHRLAELLNTTLTAPIQSH
jgi:hypothetical protein